MRRVAAWSVAVPLMLAGTELAHALAYRIVYPQAEIRWRVLEATGHGYMRWAPVVFGIAGSIVLASLLVSVLDVARRRPLRAMPPWAFGALPLAAFTIQEFMERWLAVGGLPWWMVEQPTFRIGLLLQLPFAFAAFVVARLLFRAVERIRSALAGEPRVVRLARELASWPVVTGRAPRPSALGGGHAGRGPPARALLLAPRS